MISILAPLQGSPIEDEAPAGKEADPRVCPLPVAGSKEVGRTPPPPPERVALQGTVKVLGI